MSRYDQVLASRANDLPPKWDGREVTWTSPMAGRATIVCTRGRGRDAGCHAGGGFVCTGCGAVDEAFDLYVGRIMPDPDAPLDRHLTLSLSRCLACAHDQVLEFDGAGEVTAAWDLDPSDYLDEGSVPPGSETLWLSRPTSPRGPTAGRSRRWPRPTRTSTDRSRRPAKQEFARTMLRHLYPDEWTELHEQAKLDVEDEEVRCRLFDALEHVDESLAEKLGERPEVNGWLIAWYDRQDHEHPEDTDEVAVG